eukprot:TRINITY_DN26067_c0_g1_i1.p1 TRINITY_DN26067_c0_g1~~TRINITY_DN26067_c0_g1_i1.p1  ORF type:complete len:574 (+),score=142.20 TRINITY_DN26067_c0_g1_i1:88-1809(+)
MWDEQDEAEAPPATTASFCTATLAATSYLRPGIAARCAASPPPAPQRDSPPLSSAPLASFVIAPTPAAVFVPPAAVATSAAALPAGISPRRTSVPGLVSLGSGSIASTAMWPGGCGPRLRPVDEAGLGCSSKELADAFMAQPPPVLQPEHANRLRQRRAADTDVRKEKERRERRQREQLRIAETSRGVRPGYVELFLRCYVGQRIHEGALAALHDFLFSVPAEAAEANQQAALDIYQRELKDAVAARRGKRAPSSRPPLHEPKGDALDALRAALAARVAEPGCALAKEKEQNLYTLALSPRHFVIDPEASAACGGRLTGELVLRNTGTRSVRWWLHDPELYQNSAASCAGEAENEFVVVSAGAGSVGTSTLGKREKKPVLWSAILSGHVDNGLQRLTVLESEFGFRHFISVAVARRRGRLFGSPLASLGVSADDSCGPPGCAVPACLQQLRKAFVWSGGLMARDVFSALYASSGLCGGNPPAATHEVRDSVDGGVAAESLARYGPHQLAAAIADFLSELPGRILGTIDAGVLNSLVLPLLEKGDPLGVVQALPAPDAALLLWLLDFLCQILEL